MPCKYCGKPVVLVPSAAERAAKTGGKPSDYTRLFPHHPRVFCEGAKPAVGGTDEINQPKDKPMQLMKPFDPTDLAYIVANLHRDYVINSEGYQDAVWWQSEDIFMCEVGNLAMAISQEITALIDFSDNSMIFAYEVLDDLSNQPLQSLIEQVREEGPESVDVTKWVESVVAAYPDDLSFKEPQPAPVNLGAALNLCIQAIENLLPGAKHIVADVGLINDALIAGRQAMKELS